MLPTLNSEEAYKPRYYRPIPEGAVRCMLKGRPAVRYTGRRGKAHVWPVQQDKDGNETGKMVCEERRWWMRWLLPDGTERAAKGFMDKTATEQEAARREREAARMAAGFVEVEERHLTAPLKEHLEAFLEDQERSGRSAKYREILKSRITKTKNECGWLTLRSVQPSTLTPFLASLQRKNLAPKTVNEYLNAANVFLHWCVQQGRLLANPLANVTRTDQTINMRKRRALTVEEIQRLLAAAGPRRLLYLVAVTTGIRRSELEALQWGDVHLDGIRPFIALRAETTKARRADIVPLRRDVAAEIRRERPTAAAPETKVFGRIPRMRDLKPDLERAKIDYKDADGRQADFHSLRMPFGTMLAKSGAAPRTAMELMRHTDLRLTMNVYTDPTILNTSRAVEDLPDLTHVPKVAELALTGTDGKPVDISTTVKVLPKSTTPRDAGGHLQAQTGGPTGPGAGKNASRELEMVEAVGIEPTSGCLGPEASTRVARLLNLGLRGSEGQDPR